MALTVIYNQNLAFIMQHFHCYDSHPSTVISFLGHCSSLLMGHPAFLAPSSLLSSKSWGKLLMVFPCLMTAWSWSIFSRMFINKELLKREITSPSWAGGRLFPEQDNKDIVLLQGKVWAGLPILTCKTGVSSAMTQTQCVHSIHLGCSSTWDLGARTQAVC